VTKDPRGTKAPLSDHEVHLVDLQYQMKHTCRSGEPVDHAYDVLSERMRQQLVDARGRTGHDVAEQIAARRALIWIKRQSTNRRTTASLSSAASPTLDVSDQSRHYTFEY